VGQTGIRWQGYLKFHPRADDIPRMEPDEYDALLRDIEERGIVEPLVITTKNVVLDGRHRLMAARALGIDDLPVRVVEEPGDEFEFMVKAAIIRRQLTTQQRKDLAAKLIAAEPEKSDRSIAKTTGISHPTVAKVRAEGEESGQVAEVATSTGSDGKTYPRRPTSADIERSEGAATVSDTTSYADLFAHAADPAVRYRLGEKLDSEKLAGDYPPGRLRAIAAGQGTTVGALKGHVRFWEDALHAHRYLENHRLLADIDLDHLVGNGQIHTLAELIQAIPAEQRRDLRAQFRANIKSSEAVLEALR
jgi:hypothetical protein